MNKNIEYIIVATIFDASRIGNIVRWDKYYKYFIVEDKENLQKAYGIDLELSPEIYEPYNIPKRMVLSEKK